MKTGIFILLIVSFGANGPRHVPEAGAGYTPQNTFAGSTPCDSFIRTILRIPPREGCDFIKWKLNVDEDAKPALRFKLDLLYGVSQPNTNGFKGGGTKIIAEGSGNLALSGGHPGKRLLELKAPSLASPLRFIELDRNILLFLDARDRFLVGNGGWSYILNRTSN